jgi:hypothetical protein
MNIIRNYIFLLFVPVLLSCEEKGIEPYVSFLQEQKTDPVDYILGLFDTYDIVVLGERDHRDTTQYVLIEKIMADKRFIEKVGNIFTEVGVYNHTEWANKVLHNTYASDADFEKELRTLYRELDYMLIWDKYNYWMLLKSIYKINSNLPEEQKINVHFTDVSFDWSTCREASEYKQFRESFANKWAKDSIISENFVKDYNRILNDKNILRKKALVIYNRPHSYQGYSFSYSKNKEEEEEEVKSAASYLFKAYPNQVANVMINWHIAGLESKNNLIHQGKWDAAFKVLGYPEVGFNFEDSPMGNCYFDHYYVHYYGTTQKKYKDIYTGFVFYKPIHEWKRVIGIPDLIDDDFLPELVERRKIMHPQEEVDTQSQKSYYNDMRTVNPSENMDSLEFYINEWIK